MGHQKGLPWAGKTKIDFECRLQEIDKEDVQIERSASNRPQEQSCWFCCCQPTA